MHINTFQNTIFVINVCVFHLKIPYAPYNFYIIESHIIKKCESMLDDMKDKTVHNIKIENLESEKLYSIFADSACYKNSILEDKNYIPFLYSFIS